MLFKYVGLFSKSEHDIWRRKSRNLGSFGTVVHLNKTMLPFGSWLTITFEFWASNGIHRDLKRNVIINIVLQKIYQMPMCM